METCTISTSFSGIDAPCTAFGLLYLGVLKMKHGDDLGHALSSDPLKSWRSHNLWACEWQNSAQDELLRHPASPKCLFSDISEFWLESVSSKIPSLIASRRALNVLIEQCKAATGVKREAFCHVHHKECRVAEEADLHIAGTSCVDYSVRGDRAADEGPTLPHTMCWLCMRAMLQEAYLLHENVELFNPELLLACLGAWYDLESFVIDCSELGWPVARKRRFSILRHKVKSLPFRHPSNIFMPMFKKAGLITHDPDEPTWSCFFAAALKEIHDEMVWASGRPSSLCQEEMLDLLDVLNPETIRSCLNKGEESFLKQYLDLHDQHPGLAFSLNQDPSYGPTHSTTTQMHTIIRNMGIIWILSQCLRCFG
eukprot:Skav203080  [mRNA]  locus=scaffold2182:149729:151098:+ [translate_table: standard]